MKICFLNLGEKAAEKLTKLNKIDFSVESFTAIFLRGLTKNVTIWLSGGHLSTCHQIQTFERFSCNFLIFQDPKPYVNQQLVTQFLHSLSGDKI